MENPEEQPAEIMLGITKGNDVERRNNVVFMLTFTILILQSRSVSRQSEWYNPMGAVIPYLMVVSVNAKKRKSSLLYLISN